MFEIVKIVRVWTHEGGFQINNLNFGSVPKLYIKDNRLIGVGVAQSITVGGFSYTVGGFSYAPGEVVILDPVGKIVPTQLINPSMCFERRV